MYIIVMGFVEEIFRIIDETSSTLVFPTENTARHFLGMYVRQRRTSVLASRAIALDSFKNLFAPVHERKPANKYHRLAFVSSLLSSGQSSLKYLYDDAFFSYKRRFIPFLTRILPDLVQTESCHVKSKALYSDLQILKKKYSQFLEEKGLFEPGWEKHSLEYYKGPKLDHILVGYESDIQMQKLVSELGNVDGIRTFDLMESKAPCYEQYETQEAELEALFQRLEKLKKDGVCTSDIIISTPDLDTLRQRLEKKACEYIIPLSFMGSVDLLATVPGRYLSSLMLCLSERLSFHSLETLLLNSALPYQDMAVNRSLVRFMIDNNIQGGSLDMKEDLLYAALSRRGLAEELDLYKSIKAALVALRKSSDAEELLRNLHVITTRLFSSAEFNNSPKEDADVYSFILSSLEDLGRTLVSMNMKMDDIFSVFMDELESLSYVPQDKKSGIRVYRYGQDHMMYVPYHFVVGLSDSNSQVTESELNFLEDHEVVSRITYDVTQKLFEYYATSGAHTFVSGSATSFEGSSGAPTYFILNNAVQKKSSDDDQVFEKSDAWSLGYAFSTSLAASGADLARGSSAFVKDPDAKPLSYSSLDSYIKCPYTSLVKNELLKDAPEYFEPSQQDNNAIGSFLHSVIQGFMELHMGNFLVAEKIDEYHEEIEKTLDKKLAENTVFDPYMKQSIRGNYIEPLKNVLNLLLIPPKSSRTKGYVGSFKPLRNEYELNKNHSYIGYIDTIIMDESGKIHLLDYKKGDGDPTYQLVLYRRLYDEDPRFGTDVGECLFYSMGFSSFRGFSPEAWEAQSQKLDEDIQTYRKGLSSGLWNATPSKKSCLYCKERALCRRRFNLQ